MNTNKLMNLTPTELLHLQKHIKLGSEHLESLLTEKEIDEIFKLGDIDVQTKGKMTSDAAEMSGYVTLILNTILTATLGAWMGLSGFMGLRLNSIHLFIGILSFSLTVGALVGILNFRFSKQAVRKKIQQRKLQTLEILCIKLLNQKRLDELRALIQKINDALTTLNIHQTSLLNLSEEFNDNELCLNWLNQCQKEKVMNPIINTEIKEVKSSLQEKLNQDIEKAKNKETLPESIQKLIDGPVEMEAPSKSWIKMHFKQLFVSLVPTMFGGFSSLFVYLGGAPNLAREMEFYNLFHFLTRAEIKAAQLAVAICITLYFGTVFVYMSYKSFKRDQELKKAQTTITQEENTLEMVDDKLLKFKTMYERMLRVSRIHSVVAKTSDSKRTESAN